MTSRSDLAGEGFTAGGLAEGFLGMLATGQLPAVPAQDTTSPAYYLALAPRVAAAFAEHWPVIAPALRAIRDAHLGNPGGYVAFADQLLPLLWFGMLVQEAVERPCVGSDLYCEAMARGIGAILAAGIPGSVGAAEED